MNKKILLQLTLSIFAFSFWINLKAQAQACTDDAPITYTGVPNPTNPSECFLQVNWGDAMSALICGNVGTPAPDANIPTGQRIDYFKAIVNGNEYVLYSRLDCPNGTNMLKYGIEGNTQITTVSKVDFCLANAERLINIEGVQAGAKDFNCSLVNALVVAPVELTYFRAVSKEKSNRLEWATSSEENTAVFVLEKTNHLNRSVEMVGTIDAKGFSSTMEYYHLDDSSPGALTYYRLRAIDFDGSEDISDWVVVQRQSKQEREVFDIAPIPLSNGPLKVFYEALYDESVILSVTDINGRKLYEERKELETGIYTWDLDFPAFDQHLLIFHLHSRDGIESRLIPVQRGR